MDNLAESSPLEKAGIKCEYCGSTNTFYTGFGGYQEADASRGMPMVEGQRGCLQ